MPLAAGSQGAAARQVQSVLSAANLRMLVSKTGVNPRKPPIKEGFGLPFKKREQNFARYGGFAPVNPLFLHFFQKWFFKSDLVPWISI